MRARPEAENKCSNAGETGYVSTEEKVQAQEWSKRSAEESRKERSLNRITDPEGKERRWKRSTADNPELGSRREETRSPLGYRSYDRKSAT